MMPIFLKRQMLPGAILTDFKDPESLAAVIKLLRKLLGIRKLLGSTVFFFITFPAVFRIRFPESMSLLFIHVHAACTCPSCFPMSTLHFYAHAACPCSCCMLTLMLHAMLTLHVHAHAACPQAVPLGPIKFVAFCMGM